MLTGSYHHTIEQKGRLAIPTAFRKPLGSKPIVTQGIERCLYLLPFNNWSKTISKLDPSFISSRDTRNLVRLLSHRASRVDFDSQGRILIPGELKAYALLQQKVVVAGSIDWVEIWDIATYKQHMQSIESQADSLVESLTQHE